MSKAAERLKEYGIKPSVQRVAIMEYLLNHKNHPTVDMIHHELSERIETLSKTTIYNTLKLFAEAGAILTLNIDENTTRYDGDTSHHAHFKCMCCGDIYDMTPSDQDWDKIGFKNGDGFKITEEELYLKGYCPKCNKQ